MGIFPDSEPKEQNEECGDTEVTVSAERSSHGGMRSWSYVTNSRYKGLREGGSLSRVGIMALDTCKKTCRYLHIGFSIIATLVILIQAICLGMMGGQSMIAGPGLEGSGKAPILSSENLNVGIVSWSTINEEVDEEEACQCPEAPTDLTLWRVFEYSTVATLGTLTALIIMVLGFHFGKMILKDIRSGEIRRQELKIQRMEEKLDKIKKKRAESVTQMEVAAQGFEVS